MVLHQTMRRCEEILIIFCPSNTFVYISSSFKYQSIMKKMSDISHTCTSLIQRPSCLFLTFFSFWSKLKHHTLYLPCPGSCNEGCGSRGLKNFWSGSGSSEGSVLKPYPTFLWDRTSLPLFVYQSLKSTLSVSFIWCRFLIADPGFWDVGSVQRPIVCSQSINQKRTNFTIVDCVHKSGHSCGFRALSKTSLTLTATLRVF